MIEHQERPLKPQEAADYLGVKKRTLSAWRSQGIGPRYCRMNGRLVRYTIEDLADYVRANTETPRWGSS